MLPGLRQEISLISGFQNVGGNQFRRQMITLIQFFNGHPVGKFLFGAEVQHFHIAVAVETGNFFAETAVKFAVFQRGDDFVVSLQVVKQVFVQSGQVARIDERCRNALFCQFGRGPPAEFKETSCGNQGNLAALLFNLIGIQLFESFSVSFSA